MYICYVVYVLNGGGLVGPTNANLPSNKRREVTRQELKGFSTLKIHTSKLNSVEVEAGSRAFSSNTNFFFTLYNIRPVVNVATISTEGKQKASYCFFRRRIDWSSGSICPMLPSGHWYGKRLKSGLKSEWKKSKAFKRVRNSLVSLDDLKAESVEATSSVNHLGANYQYKRKQRYFLSIKLFVCKCSIFHLSTVASPHFWVNVFPVVQLISRASHRSSLKCNNRRVRLQLQNVQKAISRFAMSLLDCVVTSEKRLKLWQIEVDFLTVTKTRRRRW